MFYCFNQNNSGGSFDIDSDITHYTVIEAGSAEEANDKAERLGIYFDGVASERDCPRCGDRWSPAWEKGSKTPAESVGFTPTTWWMEEGREMVVHYLDGRVEWFGKNNWPK